jgi:hypothetical protein
LILLFTNIFFLHISFVYLATSFSSIFYNDYLLCCLVPIKIYDNLFFDKVRILKENAGLSGGIFIKKSQKWVRYIGSSQNLRIRFGQYFRVNHLESQNSMHINRALLKYDYLNFAARSDIPRRRDIRIL